MIRIRRAKRDDAAAIGRVHVETWQAAYATGPVAFTGWVLIEEAAEGGDMLHQKATAWPAFLKGYERVCEGGNVALYRRIARTSS